MIEKRDKFPEERIGRFRSGPEQFPLGWPQAPYPYGKPF
jgi:hypothetical protein